MFKSIRARLQLWYALVLIIVVSGFAGIMYYRARSAVFREIDSQITSSALYIDTLLRNFPQHELEEDRGILPPEFEGDWLPPEFEGGRRPPPEFDGDYPQPFPPPPKKKGGKGMAMPPRRPRERLLNELALPAQTSGTATKPYFAVWRANGSVLKSVDLPEDRSPPEFSAPTEAIHPQLDWHADAREAIMRGPGLTSILVGQSTAHAKADLRSFAWQLSAAGLIVLAIGMTGGWWISSRIFRPIAAMSVTASRISATNMSDRIDSRHVDKELADLAGVLNATFDRLQQAFERQARFTADASHELRTPLAIIQSHAQLALDRPRSADEYRQTVESCLRNANRMKAMVEGLLQLARADAGQAGLQKQPVKLAPLIADAVALFRPLAEAKKVTILADLADYCVTGDPSALTQVVMNLLNNAIHYNRENGSIEVRLTATPVQTTLTVTDTGCGIPEQDQPHIFERFYRVDKARSRASGGTGLGLSICKTIIDAHGGEIGFETRPGEGSTFWVRLR